MSSIYFTWVYRSFYSNYKLHISKELTDKIKMLYDNLRTLRSTRPNVFCGFVSSFLFLVAIFGHYVSGRWIVLLCLVSAALFTSIYRVEIIKEKGKCYYCLLFFNCLTTVDCDVTKYVCVDERMFFFVLLLFLFTHISCLHYHILPLVYSVKQKTTTTRKYCGIVRAQNKNY